MKIVHCVCYDKKFIPQQLIFLNEHFSEHEQTFYVMGAHDEFNTIASHNVYRLSQSTLFIFLWDAFKADRIFFNGLFNDFIPIIFLFLPSIVKKGIWTPWGGDLYLKQYRANTFKNRIIEWIRGIFIRRLYGIATGTFGDYIKAKEWYGTNAKYLDSCPNIFSFDLSDLSIIREQAQADKVNKIITIQLGNSADPSNAHIEMLNWLAKFRHEPIQINMPLSYGSENIAYINEVISHGKSLFGENFVPLIRLMPFDEYNKYLSTIDIIILNHRRQQGLGNMFISLALGTKIYLRKEISTWKYLSDVIGCKIYDTNQLENITFDKLAFIDAEVSSYNKEKVGHLFDSQWQKKKWAAIYSVE